MSTSNCQTFRCPWSMSCFGWEQQWVLINILPIYLRHAFCHFGICTTRPVFIFSQWSQKLHEFAFQFSCFFNFMTNFWKNFVIQLFRFWKNSCTPYILCQCESKIAKHFLISLTREVWLSDQHRRLKIYLSNLKKWALPLTILPNKGFSWKKKKLVWLSFL